LNSEFIFVQDSKPQALGPIRLAEEMPESKRERHLLCDRSRRVDFLKRLKVQLFRERIGANRPCDITQKFVKCKFVAARTGVVSEARTGSKLIVVASSDDMDNGCHREA
jgi:hypothetical protein